MNFFKNTLLLFALSLSLIATGIALEEALKLYQNDTLKSSPYAIEALKESATTNSDAAYLLATSYKEGKIGDIDLELAYKWYLQAADSGDGDAMLMLGWLYYKGDLFGSANVSKAKYWFYKAAELGIDEANEMLELLNN